CSGPPVLPSPLDVAQPDRSPLCRQPAQFLPAKLPPLPCSRRRRGRHPRLPGASVAPADLEPPRLPLPQPLVLGPVPGVEDHAVSPVSAAGEAPPGSPERPHGR